MVMLSYLVNLLVLVPLLVAFALHRPELDGLFGPDTPGRRVLACLYVVIAVASLTALTWPDKAADVAHTLLPLQIGYKLLTWPAIGFANPVVKANLAVAALHCATMVSLYV